MRLLEARVEILTQSVGCLGDLKTPWDVGISKLNDLYTVFFEKSWQTSIPFKYHVNLYLVHSKMCHSMSKNSAVI